MSDRLPQQRVLITSSDDDAPIYTNLLYRTLISVEAKRQHSSCTQPTAAQNSDRPAWLLGCVTCPTIDVNLMLFIPIIEIGL